MSDRISQLQDQLNQLAEQMCNAVGILQQSALPSSLPGSDVLLSSTTVKHDSGSDVPPADHPVWFATLIARCAQEVDLLIDQLPADDVNQDQLTAAIKKTDTNNREAVGNLNDTVHKGQRLLGRIQTALVDVSACETDIRKLNL
ncbi:putative Mediator of RNA polymerase II transcription subunit 21 [Hypsibius exemplaris]|uniref:Mediator of RNA polymerase II transcription subunit 21 n=1 Tax=Hypsibius exemplaris TaxID=2072580 RepID=A0A1W0X0M4_HYPEX|nr:putative Mediator of RNA polymerase II transcription subunit 21 [Hypsibius exemplaris]